MARSYHGTALHAFRIPDELYAAAKEAAPRRGTTLAAVVRQALEELVKRDELERQWREGLAAREADPTGTPRVPDDGTGGTERHTLAQSDTPRVPARGKPQVREGTERDS